MTIKKELNDGELKVEVSGRLDTVTSPELEKSLMENFTGVSSLILDFAQLEYISSAGLRVLLIAQKQMNKQGKMALINVNETVMEILELTGFDQILTIQ